MPLVVDLDGTLIRSDLLVETAAAFIGKWPLRSYKLICWVLGGRACLKRKLAKRVELDVSRLPYNEAVLARIAAARATGRCVYLASASDKKFVRAIAEHFGFFEGWFASDGAVNLSSDRKASALTQVFGERGFEYIGNSRADVSVFRRANGGFIVSGSRLLRRQVPPLPSSGSAGIRQHRSWLALLRPHHWAKNFLVAVPFVTSHQFTPDSAVFHVLPAFVAFSLAASSAYIVNDILDIEADRAHPTKAGRPLAAGAISILAAAAAIPVLAAAAASVASFVSLRLLGAVALYYAITLAYSLWLKKKMLVDAVVLASLYTIRVIGGAAAIDVRVSPWLLGFSVFIFFALALMKRYSEMALRLDTGLGNPRNRNYQMGDLPVIGALAAASGYSAVIVFALYLSSPAVRLLYARPYILWLACPVLLYWISRMLMLCHRRMLSDDPMIFAWRDGVSRLTFITMLLITLAAL